VNEAGLCFVCFNLLTEKELSRANCWMTLQNPE
jgi:hypothetical protein